MPVLITHELTITREQQDQYLTVPFAMPPRTARLEVSYAFAGSGAGECVLDIGCVDGDTPRGWTGSARREFFLTASAATPGYQAGPLTPGPWSLMLGAYRVPAAGMTCRVEIRLYPRERRWYRGDLHHHTHHSDGAHSVAEVLDLAVRAGLDYVALTDHNTTTQNRVACESGVLVIPGVEVTSNHGHYNILGASPSVDPRVLHTREGRQAPIDAAHAAGGLVVLNHPHCDYCPWEWDWNEEYDLLEVWNGAWTGRNQRALDWWQTQLAAGRRLPAVGGSDTHSVGIFSVVRTGSPTTYVFADDLTVPALLEGLRAGRVVVSDNPEGPVIWLTAGAQVPGETLSPGTHAICVATERAEDCTLYLIGPDGPVAAFDAGPTIQWTWDAHPQSFLRAELRHNGTGWVRALTNAVYVGL